MRATVIIAAHNEGDLLWKTVKSTVETTERLDREILVADDGSTDGCVEEAQRRYPEIRVAAFRRRRGCSAAKDLGARKARGRTLLLIEPEAAVRSLAPLAGALEHVARGVDLVILPGRFVAARRTRALAVLDPVRVRSRGFERSLARRATRHGLSVETWPVGRDRRARPTRVWDRLFGALAASMTR